MSLPRPRENRLGPAIAIALVVYLIFTAMDATAKWLVGAGYPPIQVVFLRYAFHFLAVLVFFLPSEGRDILRARHRGLQAARSLALFTGTLLNFIAVKYLPLPVTISIFFATPMVVALLSVPMLGERIGPRRLAAIAAGFLGVLVITQPWGAGFHPAMILSVISMVSSSVYLVLTRMVAGADTNATSQFYGAGLATVVLIPPALVAWVPPETAAHFLLLAGLGVAGFASHALLTHAYRLAEASMLAPVLYSQIFYATAISFVIFGNVPTAATLLGAAIIIGAGLYIWRRERRLSPRR
ncbi:DMT family transporter [Halovulum dunhuangense]|uniref:DMT family transporter n=1 Tax=Halovulum dunhuangense TaxID=1505036 RepID=A0A849L4B1_9RHOB|nr:DMT family transporter [Halovulum dunhuangense]NNU81169.1 DMT family transporter [Halovulum dunhuangense]